MVFGFALRLSVSQALAQSIPEQPQIALGRFSGIDDPMIHIHIYIYLYSLDKPIPSI